MPMNVASSGPSNKANIFLGLVEYELNSLIDASHLVDYIYIYIKKGARVKRASHYY